MVFKKCVMPSLYVCFHLGLFGKSVAQVYISNWTQTGLLFKLNFELFIMQRF